MHRVISQVVIVAIAVILGLPGKSLFAATVVVGPSTCEPTFIHYTRIQDAVSAPLPPNSTVLVCPGTYPEQVVITQPLTLKGVSNAGMDAAVIISPPGGVVATGFFAAQLSVLNTDGVNVSNIAVDGNNNRIVAPCDGNISFEGILYSNSSGVVDHVTTRNQILTEMPDCLLDGGDGIRVRTTPGSAFVSNVTIQNSSVHDFQAGGIDALQPGTRFTIRNNIVRGRGRGPTQAGNGITVLFAAGSIVNNTVTDVISTTNVFLNSTWGIAVFCTQNVSVLGNTVTNTQGGIVLLSGTGCSTDNNFITQNNISGTHLFDGIYLCGNNNLVQNNIITSSGESGVHLDTSCNGSANGNNVVRSNTINEACAGLLVDPLSNGNILTGNSFTNVNKIRVAGNSCGPLF